MAHERQCNTRPGVLAIALLVACAAALPECCPKRKDALVTYTIRVGEHDRSYHVHVPPGHSKSTAVPLVLALHGGGGVGRKLDGATGGQIASEADRRGWVVVYPDGVNKGWNDGRPLKSARDRSRATVDDVQFLTEVVDRMQRDYGIDPHRVYAMGISNGGFMSYRLAVSAPARFAAIAAVTANISMALSGERVELPVPVMILNGTEDPLVPYKGGQVTVLGTERGEVLSTDDTVTWWRGQNGCTSPPKSRSLPDKDKDDGAHVEVDEHDGCAAGSRVLLYRIVGGGHTWPGGTQYLPKSTIGTVCRDIDGTKEIFDFFAAHARP